MVSYRIAYHKINPSALSYSSVTLFAGDIGFEVVVDFYHFEIGEFWFTGKGGGLFGCSQIPAGLDDPLGPLDLPATISVGMYAAIFNGWSLYPEEDGIKAYEGDFRVVSGSWAPPIGFPAAVNVQGFASRDGKMVGVHLE